MLVMGFSIIIPAYNEELGLPKVLDALTIHFPSEEIIVVDDGSEDRTYEVASKFSGIKIIRHDWNCGYGAALKTGVRHATNEYLLFFDADGQHEVAYVKNFITLLKDYDLVIGERTNNRNINPLRMPGKFVLKIIVNFLAKTKIKDINCGFRAVRKSFIKKYFTLLPDGFSCSTTLTLLFIKRKYRIKFVPVSVNKRIGKSSVRQIRDGYNTLILIIRLIALFDPLRIFMPVSAVFVITGIIYGLYKIITLGFGLPVGALAFLITGLLCFLLGIICDQMSSLRLERFEEPDAGL